MPGQDTIELGVAAKPGRQAVHLYHGFWLRTLQFHDRHITSHQIFRRCDSEEEDRFVLPAGETGSTAGIIRLHLRFDNGSTGFGWIKLGFDTAERPVCFMLFPDHDYEDAELMKMSTLAEEVVQEKHGLRFSPGTSDMIRHPFFDDSWTTASRRDISELPEHCFDSRMQGGSPDGGFECSYQAPLFKVEISAQRVPDMTATSGRKQEVWAVSIIAGNAPAHRRRDARGCCC